MDGDRNISSSAYNDGDRGAGGKLRKTPARKKQVSTPYDRPLAIRNKDNGGWLSKLVNPAYRFIAGGATKLIPSYFYKSESEVAETLLSNNTSDSDDGETEVKENARIDDKHDAKLGISSFIDEAGPSHIKDRLKDNSENGETEQENVKEPSYDSELAKIEHLVNGNRFSRDELKRLTEILNSRVLETSGAQQEKESPSLASWGQAKGSRLEHSSPKLSFEREDKNRALPETPAPHVQPNIGDEVTASPVDIARAYMGGRSEAGLGSYNIKDERALEKTDVVASRPYFLTPSTKSSTCWPGAMVHDSRGYLTPQNERGRYGLHNFPRTPYSRTLHSKSKTKLTELQADSRCLTNSLTPFQQTRTSNYAQLTSRNNVVDGGYGSVGPVRRIRNKFASGASLRGPTSVHSVQNTRSLAEKSNAFGGVLPVSGKNLEPIRMSGASFRGSSSLYSVQNTPAQVEKPSGSGGFFPFSERKAERTRISTTPNYQSADPVSLTSEVASVMPAPSQAARLILEQLDKRKPTPKEKSEEIKSATGWKRSSEDETVVSKAGTSGGDIGGPDKHNKGETAQKITVEGNDNIVNRKNLHMETDAQNTTTETSTAVVGDSCVANDASLGYSFGFKNASQSQIKSSTHEKTFMGTKVPEEARSQSQLWPPSNPANGQDTSKLPPVASRSDSMKKRTLKPISFKRPDPQRVVSSDNGSGFTFPFSGPGSLQSEPPTPSILPSFSAIGVPPQEGPTNSIPVYNFGTKKPSSRLVFSFPSTSSSYTETDASDLKFKFGSDNKSRISFRSVGNGPVV